jgi:hypothetical protein
METHDAKWLREKAHGAHPRTCGHGESCECIDVDSHDKWQLLNIANQLESQRLIPVSEQLPEPQKTMLVWPGYGQNPGYQLAAYWPDDADCKWRSLDGDCLVVTHFTALPPKPE